MLYKNTLSVITLGVCILSGFTTNIARAQIDIPSGAERRPNLSMDPFERAREAVKSLPGSSTTTPVEKPKETGSTASTETVTTATEAAPAAEESAKAFSYSGIAIGDLFNVVSGGSPLADDEGFLPPKTAYPILLNLSGEIDTGAAGLWDDGTIVMQIFGYGGTTPSVLVGDFHGLSSIDTGSNKAYFKLYEAWYEHKFRYGKSSFRIGIQDWNSEFDIAEYANLFMNGTFGMGAVVNISAAPSTYPATTAGFRYRNDLTEDAYFQFAIFDGAADEGGFFQVSFTSDEGLYVSTEVGMSKKEPGEDGYFKAAIGGWFLGKNIDAYTGTEAGETFALADGTEAPVNTGTFESAPGTYGAYLLGEMAIGDNIGVFFKTGWADPSYNRYSQFYAGGLNYNGLIPDRVDDVLGVAVTHTRQGQFFLDDNPNLSYIAETTYEVTYSAQINDWLMIQPDLQFIQYPAMSLAIPNSTVVGIRVQAEF